MNRSFLSAVVVLLVVVSNTDAQRPDFKCDSGKFGVCLNAFAKTVGLSTQLPWRNPREFRREIESYYQNGSMNGFLKMCSAFTVFKQCLSTEYRDCMSVYHFATGGSSTLNQAYDFASVFNQAHFTCGAGLDVFLRNEACLSSTWSQHRFHFDECYNRYYMQIEAGGNGAGCIAGRQLSECFENEFAESCTTARADVMWWGCEYGRTMMFTQFPMCSQACTTMNVGGI